MNIKSILKIILKIFLGIILLLIGFIVIVGILLLYFHFTSYNLKTNIQGSNENVYSYNPTNGNLGSISIETADYINYIDNYYNILGFATEPNGEVVFNVSDEIETPNIESVYYVIFQVSLYQY